MLHGVQNNPGKFVLKKTSALLLRGWSRTKKGSLPGSVRERCASAPLRATPSGHFSSRTPVRAAVAFLRQAARLACLSGERQPANVLSVNTHNEFMGMPKEHDHVHSHRIIFSSRVPRVQTGT